MSFDLRPRNKAMGDFEAGGFFWPWMLEAGVGLPVGHGPAFSPGQFIYRRRPDGKSLGYNDGARVTSAEAKQMAMLARWVADHQDMLDAEWEKLPEAERTRMAENRTGLYKKPVRRDWVEHMRAFAEWAEKSGGFRVY